MARSGADWCMSRSCSLAGGGLVVLLVCAVWMLLVPAAQASGCVSGQQTFTYNAIEQCYTVPAGVTNVQVVAVGAPGGASVDGVVGGDGGRVTAEVPVSGGETLYVEVGGPGGGGAPSGGSGGLNGGALGGGFGGGGGGASDVRSIAASASGSLQSRLVIAAGGGGGGEYGGVGGGAGSSGVGAQNPYEGAGGSAGTSTAGGPGGANGSVCTSCASGASGSLGAGGAGGGGGYPAGGGGGGGLYGGGGGGAGAYTSSGLGGGGGGGGSSFGPAGASFAQDTTGTPQVTITPPPAAAELSSSSLAFSPQPQTTLSAPQTLTIKNDGGSPLTVSGFTFAGADAGDFLIGSDNCRAMIDSGQTCQLTVRFAPQAPGSRSATLEVQSNDPNSPTSVALSGTGGELPRGAVGPTGPQGPAGVAGPRGPAGEVELITCQTVTHTVTKRIRGQQRKVAVSRQECTGRVVSSPVKFTTAGIARRANITRGHALYATGTSVANGRGRSRLAITDLRPLPRGRYTLTLRTRRGQHWINQRTTISIDYQRQRQ